MAWVFDRYAKPESPLDVLQEQARYLPAAAGASYPGEEDAAACAQNNETAVRKLEWSREERRDVDGGIRNCKPQATALEPGGSLRSELTGLYVRQRTNATDFGAHHAPMQNFLKLFVGIERGMWTCIEDGQFNDPPHKPIKVTVGSTFRKGISFMGVDLAELLDEQHAKDHPEQR